MEFGKRFPLRLGRPEVDEEVDSEFEFHLAMRRRELMELGMTPEQAQRTALERFGDLRQARRTCRAIGHQREVRMRLSQYLSELRQDVAFSLRQMVAAPGFFLGGHPDAGARDWRHDGHLQCGPRRCATPAADSGPRPRGGRQLRLAGRADEHVAAPLPSPAR